MLGFNTGKHKDSIEITTDYDGDFRVTITTKEGEVVFSENLKSANKTIILKGFSLNDYSLNISPIPLILK
ncbi:hypothetical protein [Winogradskyella luteola]|uniref:Uncharacterized protein n=1 Tax=Winogradskyella luteola TaxID=2828330 RepID=A0A9X1JQD6_9FLAO|nr:hypothetical protein [Winogradskyella luteola]MBV7269724.1 hypothetical protein [Winogradskyella luteola]